METLSCLTLADLSTDDHWLTQLRRGQQRRDHDALVAAHLVVDAILDTPAPQLRAHASTAVVLIGALPEWFTRDELDGATASELAEVAARAGVAAALQWRADRDQRR